MSNLTELQKRFINLRFGAFIHFNSGTFQFHTGDITDWEYGHENDGHPRKYPFDPKDWNPTDLDCAKWAKVAKSAGCRFSAFTVKHHEGFASWPTAFSEHCVRNATVKTDVVAEYLKAFRAEGIEAGIYFSVLDLTAGINRKNCTEEHKKIIKGQLTELLTNYGKIPFIIIDGWNAPWGGPTYEMLPFEEIDGLVKSLQPDCLLMNIGYNDDIEKTDIIFYENGAGQEVEDGFKGPGILCQKFTGTWMWRDTDAKELMNDADWILNFMDECFKKNVNFILNISPNVTGSVDDNQAAEFAKVGKKFVMPEPLNEIPEGWLMRK